MTVMDETYELPGWFANRFRWRWIKCRIKVTARVLKEVWWDQP